jgi:hypothetical protein
MRMKAERVRIGKTGGMIDAGGPERTIGGELVHQGPPANFNDSTD